MAGARDEVCNLFRTRNFGQGVLQTQARSLCSTIRNSAQQGAVQVNVLSEEVVEVALKSDGSGEGMDGNDGADVLPPLAPGQKPRAQKAQ